MLELKTVMTRHGIDQQTLASQAGISQAAVSLLINRGQWPRRNPDNVRSRIADYLHQRGIDTKTIFNEAQSGVENNGEENMLMKKQVLTPATRRHFGLFRDPFADDALQSCDDVFSTPDIRYVREAMYQTARHGGFIAVVGESGSGKSTLRRDLIERINNDSAPVVVIEPYVLAMEDNDNKGKTLKAAAIAEAIINTLAPLEGVKRSQDARFRQLHRALKNSNDAGYAHTLIIEEAHSLPVPTLKHLKRFFELESGFKKLLSIILIGQPELALKLSERNSEVREVVQRCEVVTLAPLDNHLEQYLEFKFARVERPLAEIMDAGALDAIRARLTNQIGGQRQFVSLLYPLAISNLTIAGMNLAASIGVPVVTADVIKGV